MEFAAAVPGGEFMDLADLARLQRERWSRQFVYVAARSRFYETLWKGRRPDGRLGSLGELPFTTKEMLRIDQRQHGPFGSYLAAAPARISRVHRTSGTTGTAMNIALAAGDTALTAAIGARAQGAAGLGPGHRVVHCLNYQLWMGGVTDHLTLEATGATVIPYGVGGSEKLIETIRELGVTAISCTPSYPAVLERVLAESFPALEPRDLGLKLGLFGGEAGLDDPAFRARLEQTWGFAVRNANYGVSDVLCNFAGQTELDDDLHFMALDVLYPELVDADDGRPLPWREGETGELVLTHLAKECQPLVRFRTGDIVTLTGLGAAACGRTAPRFRVVGRADDMVVVRGINVFPTMVAAVVNRHSELSGEYRIVLPGRGPYDRLPLEAERAEGAGPAPELAARLEAEIKARLGVTAEVTVLAPASLPRSEGKTRRVVVATREDPR
jgi:phenylacetate-CoA ligase